MNLAQLIPADFVQAGLHHPTPQARPAGVPPPAPLGVRTITRINATSIHDPATQRERRPERGEVAARLINILTQHPESTAREIADHAALSLSSINTAINRLSASGQIVQSGRGFPRLWVVADGKGGEA